MPRFTVLRRVDAWIDYVAEVQAESATEAALAAYQDDRTVAWRKAGEAEFWNARFATLDEQGGELAETVITRGC